MFLFCLDRYRQSNKWSKSYIGVYYFWKLPCATWKIPTYLSTTPLTCKHHPLTSQTPLATYRLPFQHTTNLETPPTYLSNHQLTYPTTNLPIQHTTNLETPPTYLPTHPQMNFALLRNYGTANIHFCRHFIVVFSFVLFFLFFYFIFFYLILFYMSHRVFN